MKYLNHTVNANGIEQIRAFLTANYRDSPDFTDANLSAWARDAEFQLGEGNEAMIEIPARHSITGAPVCYTITADGLDAYEYDDGEDETS